MSLPRRPFTSILIVAAAVLARAAPALADAPVQAAPGARNLAAGGGYLAWAAPTDAGRWKLTVRAPDGTVTTPAIPSFGAPPDTSIGSDRAAFAGRRLLAVYARCAGSSATDGCDGYALNLRTGQEERIAALSTHTYSETSPQLAIGNLTAVRRGGPRPGIYSFAKRAPRRLTPDAPVEIAASATRVVSIERAHGTTYWVVLRRRSGKGAAITLEKGLKVMPRSLVITRYRAGWLVGNRVFQTTRFAGSGGPYSSRTQEANRALPASVDSITTDESTITRYLDDEGIKAVGPPLFG